MTNRLLKIIAEKIKMEDERKNGEKGKEEGGDKVGHKKQEQVH